jgi:hypothetical protein
MEGGRWTEWQAEIRRHGTFTADEFQALAVATPLDPRQTHRRIKTMLEDAAAFIQLLPSDAVGFLFLDGDRPTQPDPALLDRYTKRGGARRGCWPSSSEIGTAMLEHYGRESP